jgi:hypothetical protein
VKTRWPYAGSTPGDDLTPTHIVGGGIVAVEATGDKLGLERFFKIVPTPKNLLSGCLAERVSTGFLPTMRTGPM